MHKALEIYYDPKRWVEHASATSRAMVEYESEFAFLSHLAEWKKRLQETGFWESQEARHDELAELGLGMLQHYFKWAPKNDKEWIPIKSEIEFEVPVPVPNGLLDLTPRTFNVDKEGNLLVLLDGEWARVVYQGRIDLIVQFSDGRYGVLDHKTAAQFGQTEHLELDTQTRSYAWACKKMLGLDISTIIYSELKKSVPKPPRVLKSGYLSQAKNQGTTVELYVQALKERGEDPEYYANFLTELEFNQQEYFRRIEVGYSASELEMTELGICMEAIDMLNDPFIYPNPDRWNCNGCAFRTPCVMRQEKNDYKWHLENSGLYTRDVAISTRLN
jgi:hypothetical protein